MPQLVQAESAVIRAPSFLPRVPSRVVQAMLKPMWSVYTAAAHEWVTLNLALVSLQELQSHLWIAGRTSPPVLATQPLNGVQDITSFVCRAGCASWQLSRTQQGHGVDRPALICLLSKMTNDLFAFTQSSCSPGRSKPGSPGRSVLGALHRCRKRLSQTWKVYIAPSQSCTYSGASFCTSGQLHTAQLHKEKCNEIVGMQLFATWFLLVSSFAQDWVETGKAERGRKYFSAFTNRDVRQWENKCLWQVVWEACA